MRERESDDDDAAAATAAAAAADDDDDDDDDGIELRGSGIRAAGPEASGGVRGHRGGAAVADGTGEARRRGDRPPSVQSSII